MRRSILEIARDLSIGEYQDRRAVIAPAMAARRADPPGGGVPGRGRRTWIALRLPAATFVGGVRWEQVTGVAAVSGIGVGVDSCARIR